MLRRSSALVLSALALLQGSCFEPSFRSAERSWELRYLPQEDALLLLEASHGASARGEDRVALERAVQDLVAFAGRTRRFPPEGGFLSYDLDDMERRSSEEAEDEPSERREEWSTCLRSVKVEDVQVFLDEQGRLGIARLTRIEHFQRVLEIANGWFNRQSLDDDLQRASREFRADFPIFDPETARLIAAAHERGHAWLRIERGAIVLDVPMTGENAARCLAWLARSSAQPGGAGFAAFLDAVSGVEVAEGHARLLFGGANAPAIRFASAREPERAGARPATADPLLLQRLREEGVEIGDAATPARLAARFQAAGEPPAPPK